jgi:dihydropteroate synthase
MGVVNVTPDSFYDGGRYLDHGLAVNCALRLIEEGADIIDIGGESTHPYSQPVSLEEETWRVLPVIEALRKVSDIFLSVDTRKAALAQKAIEAGADMINDVSGFRDDEGMAGVIRDYRVLAVLMHMRGSPGDMQDDPQYADVMLEIQEFYADRIEVVRRAGIMEEQIILDPGIGFGKRVEDNLKILKELRKLKELGRPVLIGTSMKSFIGAVTGSTVEERLEGTLASIAVSLWNGADVVRVHDVRSARKVVDLVDAIMKA